MSLLMNASKRVQESVPSINRKLAGKIMEITKILIENPSIIEKEYRYLRSKVKYIENGQSSNSDTKKKTSSKSKSKKCERSDVPTFSSTQTSDKRRRSPSSHSSTPSGDECIIAYERAKKMRLSIDEIGSPPRLSPDNATSICENIQNFDCHPVPQPTTSRTTAGSTITQSRPVIVPPRNVAALVNRPVFSTDLSLHHHHHSKAAQLQPTVTKGHRLQQLIQTGQIPSITTGTVSVPKGHRQMYLKHMVDVFKSSKISITLDEAIEKAAGLEDKAFSMHHEAELYDLVLPLLLSHDKLKENGFLTVNDQHEVEVYHSEKYNFNSKWKHIIGAGRKGLRYCTRCSKEYQVDENGVQIIPNCSFHTQRKKKMLSRVRTGESFYPCCAGEDPCTTEPYHITDNNDEIHGSFSAPFHPDRAKRVLALDCEMVATFNGIELAHIVVIDMKGDAIYESLVKPEHPIASYLTEFSGLTPQIMSSATKTLFQVQRELCQIINSDTIIIGHSLDSDFKAMKLIHSNVVDTSILFMKEAFTIDEYHYKTSLKVLAREHLSRVIQENECGHDPLEDAKAAFDVVKKHVGLQI